MKGVAALGKRPQALVCASAIGYYGSRGGELLRESSAPDALERVQSALLAELEAAGALPPPIHVKAVAEIEREPGPAAKFRVVKSAVASRRLG